MPKSPEELYLISINSPSTLGLTDAFIIERSYGIKDNSVVIHPENQNVSIQTIKEIQENNSQCMVMATNTQLDEANILKIFADSLEIIKKLT